MRKWLKFRSALFLLAVLVIIGVGITYAVQIQRQVSGSVVIGTVETVDDTILVWKSIAPTKEPLTNFEFGTGDINAFGLFKALPLIPVWVENGGDIPFGLGVGLVEVRVDGNPAGDVVSLVFKSTSAPAIVVASPAPVPAESPVTFTTSTTPGTGPTPTPGPPPNRPVRPIAVIKPGQVMEFEVGLRFLRSPGELGVGPGSSITFTARFTAVAPVPVPSPTPMPTPGPFTPVFGGVVPMRGAPAFHWPSRLGPLQVWGFADTCSLRPYL